MAERDSHVSDPDNKSNEASAAELQRKLHTTRDSITQTVAELKGTMNHEYRTTKDRAMQSIDWQVHMRRYPIAACVGALAVGFLAGRALNSRDEDDDDYGYSSSDRYITSGSSIHGNAMDSSSSSHSRHLISPEVKRRMSGRVEGVLTQIADNFLNELSRVGRDVVVPSLVSALTTKLHNVTGQTDHGSSAFASGTSHVGGTGSFGQSSGSTGASGGYPGRNL